MTTTLVVEVGDDELVMSFAPDRRVRLPVGVATLHADFLAHTDPPRASDLTNALGAVHDHVDNLLVEHPDLLSIDDVELRGHHATVLAQVELGGDVVGAIHHISRADADEVFRTVATERRADRLTNPGLPVADVDHVVATCCVALALIRRFDHDRFVVSTARRATQMGD